MWNIIRFVATLAVFYLIARLLGAVTAHAANRIKGASELLKKFLVGFVRQLVMVIGLIMAASALEVNISPLLAAIGGAAFVIGLALQGTLEATSPSGLIILRLPAVRRGRCDRRRRCVGHRRLNESDFDQDPHVRQ